MEHKLLKNNKDLVEKWSAFQSRSIFSDLPDDAIRMVIERAEIVVVPRKKLVIAYGDTSTGVYFILSGSVTGRVESENGRGIMFFEKVQGEFFGEFSTLDGIARSINVSANMDCVFGRLSNKDFLEILNKFPEMAINLARYLVGMLRHMNERVLGLVAYDVETRLRARLMQLAQDQEQLFQGGEILNLPTHEAMASYLGSNREAISRAISRLRKNGAIELVGKKVVIRQMDILISGLISKD